MSPLSSLAALLLATLLCAVVGRPQSHAERYPVRSSTAAFESLLDGEPEAWRRAESVSWGPLRYRTHFAALHSDAGLWVRFDAVDPDPWHTLEQRDDPLWNEEVVEIFIDPDADGRNYVEVEISPANVVTDLIVYRGQPDMQADIGWDFGGLTSRVRHRHLEHGEAGWTAIALLPWEGFLAVPDTEATVPPAVGDRWRFNVFRIKRPGGPDEPGRDVVLAAWSPVPGNSFHVPEVFREMEFKS